MESLAERLIRLRREKGFATQQALADASRVKQSFIGALEAGNQKTSSYLPELAHALGVDAYYLKTGIETMIYGDKTINEVAGLMSRTNATGKAIVLDKARDIASQYPNGHEKGAAA